MAQNISRRLVLAALGAGALAGNVQADHDDDCTHCGDDQRRGGHLKDTKVCTYECGEPSDDKKKSDWWDSVITIQSCSPCARKVNFRVTGCLSETQTLGDRSLDDLPQGADLLVGAGERVSLYYKGSLTNLETEHGDFNIGISQRDVHNAHHCE